MTLLCWVRTSRHIDTLAHETTELESILAQYDQGRQGIEPFCGGDELLFGLNTDYSIHSLRAFVAPALAHDWIVDWSITEVGRGISGIEEITFQAEDDDPSRGSLEFDDRFLYVDDRYEDGNPWYDAEPLDDQELAMVREAKAKGFSYVDWRMGGKSIGATILWINLAHDRQENDRTVRAIGHLLPRPYRPFWHGRTSIAFGYSASHEMRDGSPYGIDPELKVLLENDEVDDYLAFQVGSESVSANGTLLNPVHDFIWSAHRAHRFQHAHKRRSVEAGKGSKSPNDRQAPRTVIVQRVSRPDPFKKRKAGR